MSLTSPVRMRALHRGADGHHLVGVDALVGLFAEVVLHALLHERDARRAAHEHHLVDVRGALARVGEGAAQASSERSTRGSIICSSFARDILMFEVQRRLPRGGHVREVDGGLLRRRELDLGLLRGVAEALQGHLVLGQVDPLVLAKLGSIIQSMIGLVDVVAAEVGVAVGALDLDEVFADLEDRDVEGAAAEVVHGDELVLLLVEAVREGRGGGLVDDARTLSPAILPASLVAWRWLSLKYAGTVITASVTVSPR
jgi:hypothetical protein